MEQAAIRLQRTQIECLPYEDVLRRYDRESTVYYCDPPYLGASLYRHNFSEADFALLAERLGTLRGTFLLSINDKPLVRTLFGRFFCREVDVSYGSSRTTPRVTELLFSNVPLPSTT